MIALALALLVLAGIAVVGAVAAGGAIRLIYLLRFRPAGQRINGIEPICIMAGIGATGGAMLENGQVPSAATPRHRPSVPPPGSAGVPPANGPQARQRTDSRRRAPLAPPAPGHWPPAPRLTLRRQAPPPPPARPWERRRPAGKRAAGPPTHRSSPPGATPTARAP